MDKKIMAIATVVAVMAIFGGIFYAMVKYDEPESCYTLLDSSDNVKEGLTLEFDGDDHNGSFHSKRVVDYVEDGRVYYTLYIDLRDIEYIIDLQYFLPGNPFDYTSDDIPEGVTVKKVGSVYNITGTTEKMSGTVTYDLSIFYADGVVYNVTGSIKEKETTIRDDVIMTYVYETEDVGLIEKWSVSGWETQSMKVENYMQRVSPFTPETYKGATVEDGTFGGVDVKIYTFNGTVLGTEYVDYKFFVYDGQSIHREGTIIDHGVEYYDSMLVRIYQA